MLSRDSNIEMYDANIREKKRGVIVAALLAALITAIVYLPALKNGFVTWDDNEYVYNNLKIGNLDTEFVRWAFTTPQVGMYSPLTLLSLGLDFFLWDLKPSGYHLTNVGLHVLNTFLVVLCIARILQAASQAGYLRPFSPRRMLITAEVTGLLFGIHPLHVESVAWVSERKDVLYTFFFLLSVLSYLRYAAINKRAVPFYSMALLTFVLSLLSKPMAVTLPAVLIILDVYPLNRLSFSNGLAPVKKVILEKLPFLGLSMVFSVVAVRAQQTVNAMAPAEFGALERLLTAARAMFFYLQKFLLPVYLSPFYPLFLPISFTTTDVAVLLVLFGITFFCAKAWRKNRIWMIIWVYYLVSVLPVSGILQVGSQAAADRYAYMPLIGPMVMVGAGVAHLAERIGIHARSRKFGLKLLIAGLVVLSVSMVAITEKQIRVWQDGLTLWRRVFDVYPDGTYAAYLGRAEAYYRAGIFSKAVADYTEAIRLDPSSYGSYCTRGIIYFLTGRNDLALNDFNRTLSIKPGDTEAIYYKSLICQGNKSPACK